MYNNPKVTDSLLQNVVPILSIAEKEKKWNSNENDKQ